MEWAVGGDGSERWGAGGGIGRSARGMGCGRRCRAKEKPCSGAGLCGCVCVGGDGLRQGDALCRYVGLEEEAGVGVDLVGRFAGVVLTGAACGEALAHLWVAVEVVVKAGGDVLPLWDEGDALGEIVADFVEQEGIVGASEDDGVYLRVLGEEFVDGVFDEVICSWFVKLVVFD